MVICCCMLGRHSHSVTHPPLYALYSLFFERLCRFFSGSSAGYHIISGNINAFQINGMLVEGLDISSSISITETVFAEVDNEAIDIFCREAGKGTFYKILRSMFRPVIHGNNIEVVGILFFQMGESLMKWAETTQHFPCIPAGKS